MIEILEQVEALLQQASRVQETRRNRLELHNLQKLGALLTRITGLLGEITSRATDDVDALRHRTDLADDEGHDPVDRVTQATRALAEMMQAMTPVIGHGAIYHGTVRHLTQTDTGPI